jgi:hypothetical protein
VTIIGQGVEIDSDQLMRFGFGVAALTCPGAYGAAALTGVSGQGGHDESS